MRSAVLALLLAACAGPLPEPERDRQDRPGRCSGGLVQSAAALAALEGCTTIADDLEVDLGGAVTDLTALEDLVYVGGSLVLRNHGLQSLRGLEQLAMIRESLVIDGRAELEEVVLPSLVDVREVSLAGDALRMISLPALQLTHELEVTSAPELDVLDLPLLQVAPVVTLRDVPALVHPTLPVLHTVEELHLERTGLVDLHALSTQLQLDRLVVVDNPALRTLAPSAGWSHTTLVVEHNPALATVGTPEALDDLTVSGPAVTWVDPVVVDDLLYLVDTPSLDPSGIAVTGLRELRVEGLDGIEDLSFLTGLGSVFDELRIADNAALRTLHGLGALHGTCDLPEHTTSRSLPEPCTVGLVIESNPLLHDVSALGGVQWGGGAFIDNSSLCDDDLQAFLDAHPCPGCVWNSEHNDGC